MDETRFRLLGPMEIAVRGAAVQVPGTGERALLAQLLLSPGRTIPATMLIDRLWSESSLPVDPMNALQIRVSRLRRVLKAQGVTDLVRREGVGYRADVAPSAVDAVDFETRVRGARARAKAAPGASSPELLSAYDEALALWRGEPLSDFNFERWAMVEAARLTELKLAATTERATVALALGRHLEVVADLEPLVSQDPTLESLAGLLMIALYRSGRQADALETYTRTRESLDELLGLEPSVSLRSLHERVLRQDESLGTQPELSLPTPVSAPRRTSEVSRSSAASDLPTVLRPLIGREAQLDALSMLLAGSRMVSLIGPGGAGKTSLALAAAVRMAGTFPDGATAVRLASVSEPAEVPLAVADALGVPLDGAAAHRDIRDRLIAYLSGRRMLLLVDNCEHLVDAAAGLIDDLLGRCPGASVLATSREALAIPDEVQVSVGPLDTPEDGTPAARILEFPAAQLFLERARAVRPGTLLGDTDLLAVGRIVRALDGMPLALELAAARMSSMSAPEIAERLTQRFTLLTTGARTAEARQKTLRATVDWSYDLLTEAEQTVFNRLSVFTGGWTLAAAEAVVSDERLTSGHVLDTMGRLVERSMVNVEPGPTTRYRMLETLRQYAGERLVSCGKQGVFARRHAEYYREVAERAEGQLRGHGQREALDRLREEQPNIRAALGWFTGSATDADSALTMAGSLGMFWHLGRHLEGREVLARLLAGDGGAPAPRARALQAVSLVERPRACLVHPSPRCAETARESLAIFEELGDESRAALSRVLLAVEGVTGKDLDRSQQLLHEAEAQFVRDEDAWGQAVIGFVRMETALKGGEESVAVQTGRSTAAAFRDLDDPWGLSATLYHLGWGLRQFGRYEEAARVLEEAIDVAAGAALDNTVQWALADLGVVHLHRGEVAFARDAFDRAAAASDHVGDGAGAVLAEYGYGLLAQLEGDWADARSRFLRARSGFGALGTPVPEGLALAGLARCEEAAGDLTSAQRLYEKGLTLAGAVGEPGLTATLQEGLARLAVARGAREEAVTLNAEADRIRERYVRPAPPMERRDRADVA